MIKMKIASVLCLFLFTATAGWADGNRKLPGTGSGGVDAPNISRPLNPPNPSRADKAVSGAANQLTNPSTVDGNAVNAARRGTRPGATPLTTNDFPNVGTRISDQRQARHLQGTTQHAQNGGGYMSSGADAQRVLDDFHSGRSPIISRHQSGDPIVRNENVTGFDNNIAQNRLNAPSHNFWIKGTKSVSVVPINPNFN